MASPSPTLRLAELIGALSHALDLTEGQPRGHSQRCCWIGTQLGLALGLARDERSDLYYTLLLKDLGCSSNAARICELYLADDRQFKRDAKLMADSLPAILRFIVGHTGANASLLQRIGAITNILKNGGEIVRELFEARCVRGAEIARMMRFSDSVCAGISSLDEHWDGSGRPAGLMRRDIPLASQIALMAQVADVFFTAGGRQAAIDEVARRKTTWFDPDLGDVFLALADDDQFWTSLASPDLGTHVVALEPEDVVRQADESYLDDVAAAFARVVDAKSSFTAGHSERVAFYAELIATELGMAADARRRLRRAALLHDIGKLGVSNAILDKPGPLTTAEFEAMKRHPIHSGEILGGVAAFRELADIGLQHHEKLDGTGYPHGLKGDQIGLSTRIVSVADVFDALTADRPYRKAMPTDQAFQIMWRDAGRALDADCLAALANAVKTAAAA